MIPRLVLALALALAGSAAMGGVPGTEPVDAAAASPQVELRARVEVGADGNGARAKTFVADATERTRYVLVAQTTPGLASLSVTLNDDVVLSSEVGSPVRIALPEGVLQDGDNRLLLSASGNPGSVARVGILAVRIELHDPRPPLERRLQFGGRAHAGTDGNGTLAALFSTTVAAPRYTAVVDRLCGPGSCAPPVQDFEVVLNGTVVAQGSGRANVPVTLAPPGSGANELIVTVRGLPRAAVRVRVFAVRPVLLSSQGSARLARGPAARGLTAPLGSTKGSVRAFGVPEVDDEVV